MKTKIFTNQKGAHQSRLEIGPFASVLDDYIEELNKTGYPMRYLAKAFRVILRFSDWVGLKNIPLKNLNQDRIEEFWNYHGSIRKHCDYKVLGTLIEFLRIRKLIPLKPVPKIICPIEKQIFLFETFLRQERGLSSTYIYQQIRVARFFLQSTFPVVDSNFNRYNAKIITDYMNKILKENGSGEVRDSAVRLMGFFKYLFLKGKTKLDLSKVVPRPANWHQQKLPIYIGPDEVQKLLNSCDQNTVIGSRDYAVLMMLSRLGLRACEIKNLNLDDIHWRDGSLTIRGKGKESKMPLANDVGEALAIYIKKYRPQTPARSVFVSIYPPHHGFRMSMSVSGIVKFALDRAGIKSSHQGAYLLRHTVANQCLKNGATLAEVGKLLRHENAMTTTIYAKVDISRLSSVTRPWAGGVQ